jgi:hypothetical protein
MEKLQALPKGMQKTSQESRMGLHQRYNNGGTREQQSEAVLEIGLSCFNHFSTPSGLIIIVGIVSSTCFVVF